MFWSKIFWHNHICYHTRVSRSQADSGVRNWDRKNIGKGRKKPHWELVLRAQSFITLDFQGLKFQTRCEQKLKPVVQLSTGCQSRESPPHTLSQQPPFPSRLLRPCLQVINGESTQTQHKCEWLHDELLWQEATQTKLSFSGRCVFLFVVFVLLLVTLHR